jgi:hypothetical protein
MSLLLPFAVLAVVLLAVDLLTAPKCVDKSRGAELKRTRRAA